MRKEIIVNADDLESRVAVLEDGQLAELHVERELRMVGSIYKARVVSVLPGMDAAFADIGLEKNVFLSADDVGFVSADGIPAKAAPRSLSISERVRESQEVVVQIVRAPVGGKGARASTRLALPGRYLVLLLSNGRQVGVSRKIEERKERERLRKIGEKVRPQGMGLIIRTEAEGRGRRELEADLEVLQDLRGRITSKAEQTRAPALLHQDLTLTYQVIRDVFTDDVKSLVIDSKSAYDNAVELVQTIAPHLRRRVKRYRGKLPLFHKYGIEAEIDRLLRRRVWLKAGGYISIDQAEAFTAIDVNTGRYTGGSGLADTILRTNLEAAEEIGRQLRLRDLGGIIVIDFIDMERQRDRQRVMKEFEETLRRDRQKTKIVHLSPLGLLEMTRKRRGESLMGILTDTCPQCGGLGRVRDSLTVGLKIERDVRRLAAEDRAQAIIVRASPRVAALLIGDNGERADALENMTARPVYIRADERLPAEEHDITTTTLARVAHELKLYHKSDEVVVDRMDPREPAAGEEAYGWCDGYRVEMQGAVAAGEAPTVVLAEAGHSFGRGRVKGTEAAAAPAKEGPPRRSSRRRSRGKRPAQQAAPAELAPHTGAGRTGREPAPAAAAPPLRESVATAVGAPEAAPTRKKPGSRRRGGRRTRRQPAGESPAAGEAAAREPEPVGKAQAPPPAAEVSSAQVKVPAETPARRPGLLRRGARQILRPRR